MNPFHEKKVVAKKKKNWYIGIAPLSIKVSESRKSKSGLEKKTLLLFLSTTAFSNWRGKPSSAKHKLHPNGFCLYLIPRKKSQTKSRLMSSVLSTMYVLYYLNNGILFPKLFRPTVRKNCSSDWEKLLKFEAEIFEITRTIYSNSERSEQFLVTECFFNLFLEVSHIY